MPHSKHRKKTLRQNEGRRLKNRAERATMRTAVKRARGAAESEPANADPALADAARHLDKAGKKNLIHPNKAARLKSRLAKARNRAAAEK